MNFVMVKKITIGGDGDVKCEVSSTLQCVWIGDTWFTVDEAKQLVKWLCSAMPVDEQADPIRCKHQWIGIDHMMWKCALCSVIRDHA